MVYILKYFHGFFIFYFILFCSAGNLKTSNQDNSTTGKILSALESEQVDNYKTIFIEFKPDKQIHDDLVYRFKNYFMTDFAKEPKFKIVEDSKSAELVLSIMVSKYLKLPAKYDIFRKIEMYNVSFSCFISVLIRKEDKSIERFYDRKAVKLELEQKPNDPPYETDIQVQNRVYEGITRRIKLIFYEGAYSKDKTPQELGFDPEEDTRIQNYQNIPKNIPSDEIEKLKEKYKPKNGQTQDNEL